MLSSRVGISDQSCEDFGDSLSIYSGRFVPFISNHFILSLDTSTPTREYIHYTIVYSVM